MKYPKLMTCIALAAIASSCGDSQEENFREKLSYPDTKKVEQEDDYFGTLVSDPYRWLEDDRSEETASWVKEQNKVTFDYLENINYRDEIKQRLEEIWNYPKYGSPFKAGDNYFFYKNDGLQNQSVLYVQPSLDDEPEVLLDPNSWSEDGTVSLGSISASKDGKHFAYSVQESGSDWSEIKVMEVDGKKELDDEVGWVKFSGISWYEDGFFYSSYERPEEGSEYSKKNEFHKVFYHKLGEEQQNDELIYEDQQHALRNFYAQTTEDERFLIINGSEGTSGNSVWVKDLSRINSEFVALVEDFDNDHSVVDSDGDDLLMITNYEAPNNRLVRVSLKKPGKDNWEDVIGEEAELLQSVNIAGGRMFVRYLKDAYSQVYQYGVDGSREKEIELPGIGSAGGFAGKKDDTSLFYTFTSFTFPTAIYRYDIGGGESELFRASDIDFDPEAYETKQVFYSSKDGTKVPMFIVHKKGLELNGENPTFLYSYGGFDISMTPGFSVARLAWLEQGGIYAQPSIRGGGEYGQAWHEGGMLENKQNVFDDFISAAEYLIAEKYTSSERLAISGGSNGGLLVGAAMTQRPELFKVALPAVGVLDMLRYHKFTIGWAWAVEYGSSEDSAHFDNLLAYSPLHNIEEGVAYPATLVTTADHDDRVVPAHSFKFISALQENHGGNAPVLIRIETKAGHGAGKPTSKQIEEWADKYAFSWHNMNFEPSFE